MSIGLLVISHNTIGSALVETATKTLGHCPLIAETLEVSQDSDLDLLRKQAGAMLEELDQGDGVLVLTDMYGSTPSNIATGLKHNGRIAVVAGVNLPMLVRILNYPDLDLVSLTEKALSGGCAGVMECQN